MNQTNWYNCYDDGWKEIIVPEAFSHPAKMACGLTKRIFKHALSEGWLTKGDVVVDPFGGIGSTGIIGAYMGLRVVCVELEEKFVDLGRQNFGLHQGKLAAFRHMGHSYQPQIIQGDSRQLSEVIAKADCLIGSPPFCESSGAMAKPDSYKGFEHVGSVKHKGNDTKAGYGQSPGQLGAMKPGSVAAVVSSPPYAECLSSGKCGIDLSKAVNPSDRKERNDHSNVCVEQRYSTTPGNLGNLKPGEVDGIISSPPYEEGIGHGGTPTETDKQKALHIADSNRYSQSSENMGNQRGETFWQAARQIVSECHKILKPGGYAIWVVKAFVRKGRRVDFPGDWRRLCESQGFKTVCVHHAMLVKETRTDGLFEEIVETKERKSFFRGLAEINAAYKKYWNTVPSEHEKAAWRFKASMLSRWWSDPLEIYRPLAMCFTASGEKVRDWNEHVRIDYEVVLCTQKT